jgi:hypothetical protein
MKTETQKISIAKNDSETARLKMRFHYGPHKHGKTVVSDGIAINLTEKPSPLALIDPRNPDPGLSKIFKANFPEISNGPGVDPQNPPWWGGDVWVSRIGNCWYLYWANWQFITRERSRRICDEARCISARITRAEAFYFLSLLLMPAEFRRDIDCNFRREERKKIRSKRLSHAKSLR